MNESVEPYTLDVLSGYLNQALRLGKEVGVLNKFNFAMRSNFPPEFGVYNFENGRDRPEEVAHPWIDDAPVSGHGWSHSPTVEYPEPGYFVRFLADRVSRGGQLLLSLSPPASGALPDEEKRTLREMGDWLKINGEAIYGTQPWATPAETAMQEMRYEYRPGHLRWRDDYTAEDFRFTRKDDALYAIGLVFPENGKAAIRSLANGAEHAPDRIGSVQLLGHNAPLPWTRDESGLRTTLPEEKPCDFAYVLKIRGESEMRNRP
jgi:alpha-L-fucosidase